MGIGPVSSGSLRAALPLILEIMFPKRAKRKVAALALWPLVDTAIAQWQMGAGDRLREVALADPQLSAFYGTLNQIYETAKELK